MAGGGLRTATLLSGLALFGCEACEALVGIHDRDVYQAPDADPGPSGEGGTEAMAPAEASLEAAPEAPADPEDAGRDVPEAALAEADAAGLDPDVPCAMQPGLVLFCDDFDSDTDASYGAEFTYQNGSGAQGLDMATFVSAPNSAVFTANVDAGAPRVQGSLHLLLASGVRVAFDVRLDAPSYGSVPNLLLAEVAIAGGHPVQLSVGPGAIAALKSTAGSVSVTPLPLATWMRVVVEARSDGTVSLLENAAPAGATTLAVGDGGTSTVSLGLVATSGTASAEYDNIVVTVAP